MGICLFRKVEAVEPLSNYVLLITFASGEKKKYDVKQIMGQWRPLSVLVTHKDLFTKVYVGEEGYSICWNDELELFSDELYEHGKDA